MNCQRSCSDSRSRSRSPYSTRSGTPSGTESSGARKKRKKKEKKKAKKRKKEAINARIKMRMEQRDREENAWDGWICTSCQGKNYMMKTRCYKCKALRPLNETQRPRSPLRKRRRSSRSISSSRAARRRRRARERLRDDTPPRGSSPPPYANIPPPDVRNNQSGSTEVHATEDDPAESEEVKAAKADARKRLAEIKRIPSSPERKSLFKNLLREWHPDKNADRLEVATAVFQLLQSSGS